VIIICNVVVVDVYASTISTKSKEEEEEEEELAKRYILQHK